MAQHSRKNLRLLPARDGVHAAVNLRHAQAPIAELTDEIIERVFMLGEDEQLHVRVSEDAHRLRFHSQCLDFRLRRPAVDFEMPRFLVIQNPKSELQNPAMPSMISTFDRLVSRQGG